MQSTIQNLSTDALLIWPDYRPTPLISLPYLAEQCRVAHVMVKLENERPLGNFKSLGGMIAGLKALANAAGHDGIEGLLANPSPDLPMLICASDGNHGLAVAAAAQRVGARATIFLHKNVPAKRAERIAALGATIIWVDGTYDDAVIMADAAVDDDAILVCDTTDRLDDPIVATVMQGYGLISSEIREHLDAHRIDYPSHMFVQAGVGGLAAAMADGLCAYMRRPGRIIVVEPQLAPCVQRALEAGAPELVSGALDTHAEMLACGLASMPAIATLLRHQARPLLVDETTLQNAPDILVEAGGPPITPSGAAGLAGLLRAANDPALRTELAVNEYSSVLLIATEEA